MNRLFCVLAAVFFCVVNAAWALDPSLPPSGNFDLSHWKLTLPVDSNGTNINDPVEKTPSQLVGFTNQYFFTGPGGEMVFWCPVNGAKTDNTSYPRTELRERINPANDSTNWKGYGTHILDAQCKVLLLPGSKKTIIGQIHSYTGAARPLIKLQSNNGTIEALVKFSPNSDTDTKYTFSNIGLSNAITYQIKVLDGDLAITVNGTTKGTNIFLTDPDWTNQTFYFKAGNYCQDNAGTNGEGAIVSFTSLSLTHITNLSIAPIITNQPVPLTIIPVGSNATFSVTAGGSVPLSYRWRFNTTNIANATNASFTVTNAQLTNAGPYTVVITNASGSVTSGIASLMVGLPPVITNQPTSLTNLVNSSAAFSVTAGGTASLNYRWRFNTTNIPNATNTSYSINSVQLTNDGDYTVIITNTFGSITSSIAKLAVYAAPVIITSPQSQTVPQDGDITLSVTVTGTPAPAYQWRTNSVEVTGSNNASFAIVGFQSSDELLYDVVITNIAGAVTSSPAQLYLDAPLRFTNFSLVPGSNCSLVLLGKKGSNYILQSSVDMSDWNPILTNSSVTGIQTITDDAAPASGAHFYRALTP